MRLLNFLNEITKQQLNDLEKFAERILNRFDVDVEFTNHFKQRIKDTRNDPIVAIEELKNLFKKIKQNRAERIKQMKNVQVILKDMETDLNLPVVVNYKDGDFEVVHKTIMRKKNFKTSNKTIKYQ